MLKSVLPNVRLLTEAEQLTYNICLADYAAAVGKAFLYIHVFSAKYQSYLKIER